MARVLVTRPEPGATETAERLRALGHDVMVAPLFTVHSVEWTPPGEKIDAVMLTSANALRLSGPLPDRWRALPCYAVGKATALTAAAHGFTGIVTGTGDAEALMRLMAEDGIGTAVHLAGREHRPPASSAPTILTRIVYAADPVSLIEHDVAARLSSGVIDWVLLYSARAASHFGALVDNSGVERARIALGAISRTVADAAGQGWSDIAIAAEPREDQLFAACGLLCDKPDVSER